MAGQHPVSPDRWWTGLVLGSTLVVMARFAPGPAVRWIVAALVLHGRTP